MKYYAHSIKGEPKEKWQTIKAHLEETAELSGEFAEKFNQKDLGYIAGLFHDLGKYSEKFQDKIKNNPKIQVDHSTAGAQKAVDLHKNLTGDILAYCIAGHHGSLQNTNELKERLAKKTIEAYSDYKEDGLNLRVKVNSTINYTNSPFSVSFLIRILYSCLVDADWLNSAGEKSGNGEKLVKLQEKLVDYLNQDKFVNATGPINKKRAKILEQCRKIAKAEKGLYSLTVPTGGGKTLSSLSFAMEHAVEHKMDRIIYAIPYTSIIEQNAQVFRDIFGEENVLEHHCNYIFEEEEKDDEDCQEVAEKLKKASDNWDMPIIATTNVQFFESLFASKKKRCRKLHNIANSVIILDEAQMIPPEYLIPCINAIAELVHRYNCTVVLCTATQPAIKTYFKNAGIEEITEIIPNTDELFEMFNQRVNVEHIDRKTDEELIELVSNHHQVLVIVNTKKHALELYNKLENQEGVYHLSTFMCPIHRKQILKKLKGEKGRNGEIIEVGRLEQGLPTKVISTQLIEAGVDIDFPYVYRSSAGLDSIAQSAGRCNREGLQGKGVVYVFESEVKVPQSLIQSKEAGDSAIKKFANKLSSINAITYYFKKLYRNIGEKQLDLNSVMDYFRYFEDDKEFYFDFKNAAKDFRFIKKNTRSIVIDWNGEAKKYVDEIKRYQDIKKNLRRLQPYTVSLQDHEYQKLKEKGLINDSNELIIELIDAKKNYDEKAGIAKLIFEGFNPCI